MMHVLIADDGYRVARCRMNNSVIHLPSEDTIDLRDISSIRLSCSGLMRIDNDDCEVEYILTDEAFAYFEAKMAILRPVMRQVFENRSENQEAADDPRNPRDFVANLQLGPMRIMRSLTEHLLERMYYLGSALPGIAMCVTDSWEGMPIPSRYERKPVI